MAEFIILAILLILAAITAASETSIIAVSRLRLRKKAQDGSKTAKIILRILETPEKFFGTLVVTNNIMNSLIAVLITALLIRIIGAENNLVIILATLLASFLIIVFEVTAKTFAATYSEKAAWILARPLRILIVAFSPFVKIFELITQTIIRAVAGKAGRPSLVTEEEIKALIKIGEEEGVLHKEKYKMLSKVFQFSETIVKDVMAPKEKMVSIDINSTYDEILDKVMESGYSRIPVYKDKADNIIGIINMKDLLALTYNKELVVLQDIVYPAAFISGTKKVTELLKEFQKGRTHIAIVRDAEGALEGLVTLEDVLEEIVGEIEDEHDIRDR